MAYTTPTAADLKARFPTFSTVADMAVQGAITEGDRRADGRWPEGDRTLAVLLYAAHVLTQDGLGSGREGRLLGFKSVKIGPLELGLGSDASESSSALGSTSYGRRYLDLVRLNFSGGFTA